MRSGNLVFVSGQLDVQDLYFLCWASCSRGALQCHCLFEESYRQTLPKGVRKSATINLNRQLSRQLKGSKNWRKACRRLVNERRVSAQSAATNRPCNCMSEYSIVKNVALFATAITTQSKIIFRVGAATLGLGKVRRSVQSAFAVRPQEAQRL